MPTKIKNKAKAKKLIADRRAAALDQLAKGGLAKPVVVCPPPDPTPALHIKRMSGNFVSLASVTRLHEDPAKFAEVLEKWFWERYDELIAAAMA